MVFIGICFVIMVKLLGNILIWGRLRWGGNRLGVMEENG